MDKVRATAISQWITKGIQERLKLKSQGIIRTVGYDDEMGADLSDLENGSPGDTNENVRNENTEDENTGDENAGGNAGAGNAGGGNAGDV